MANYKICIVFNGVVEKCMYRNASSQQHAKNIGNLILRDLYGMKRTGHYITTSLVDKPKVIKKTIKVRKRIWNPNTGSYEYYF